MTSHVIRRRRSNRRLLTVSKVKRATLTAFAIACMALPLGIALAGNLGGVR